IPLVLQVALGQRPHISVFGTDYPTPDGSCIRDYIHVDDLANAHLMALAGVTPGTPEAFNVGTGRGQSVLEVISVARRVTGHAIPIQVSPRRAGDPPVLYANSDKLQHRFGWSPQNDLEKTIETAWNWHRRHPDGFASRR